MELKPVPRIESREDVREYLGALGVHAMEIAHGRLTQDELSSTKLLLDFAELATKLADLHPKAQSNALLNAGNGAVINFHFSKPPPGMESDTITINATPLTVEQELELPPPTPALMADALLINDDL